MPFDPNALLIDFAIVSLLLVVGQFIRAKVKFIQSLFLPASVIAGVIALILGPQFLDILPFSDSVSSYANLLVAMLFATLFLGRTEFVSPKKVLSSVGDTFLNNMLAEFSQFGVALLFGLVVFGVLFPSLNDAFALLLPAGWAGGYGYATAIGGVLETYGFTDATTVGLTMATAGMFTGILGGLLMINIGTRMGVTNFVKKMSAVPQEMRTGLIAPENQKPMGMNTTNAGAIDPLAWHLALVLIATGIGYYANAYLKVLIPGVDVPLMCLSMLAGVVIQFIMRMAKMDHYVDKEVIGRIGSGATDYMVVFGIGTIRIEAVIQYAIPLLLLILLGFAFCCFFLWVIGPRSFHNNWFERSIFVWGWATGNVAMGVTLLRIVDPDFESGALDDYGLAYILIAFIEIALVSLVPVFVGSGFVWQTTLVLLAISAALFVLMKVGGFWHKAVLREKKAE